MIERGGGRIVNVASVAGLVGQDPDILDAVGYSASKGAVVALTRDLAVKWASARRDRQRRGARLLPDPNDAGPDRTARSASCREPDGPNRPAGELKGVVLFLASDASSYVTGQMLAVDGGMTAW